MFRLLEIKPAVGPLFIGLALIAAGPVAAAQPRTAALRIVVIEGEDAVSVIQQKSAVAPIVEVRDRNDQPVAGAIVNFAVRSGRATFGGARTLSVTTNAAGRAVAAGLTPTGTGTLQITATAAFQGQSAAAVTIAQTTVQTVAEAAAASSAGGSGGGLSLTTIGIIGGAAAGGLVAVDRLGVTGKKYVAQFSGTLLMVFSAQCNREERQNGKIQIELSDEGGAVDGSAAVDMDIVYGTYSCGNPAAGAPQPGDRDSFGSGSARLSGAATNFTFTKEASNRFPASGNFAGGVNAYSFSFVGSLNGSEITGVLTVTRTITNDGSAAPGRGTATYSVTLR